MFIPTVALLHNLHLANTLCIITIFKYIISRNKEIMMIHFILMSKTRCNYILFVRWIIIFLIIIHFECNYNYVKYYYVSMIIDIFMSIVLSMKNWWFLYKSTTKLLNKLIGYADESTLMVLCHPLASELQ